MVDADHTASEQELARDVEERKVSHIALTAQEQRLFATLLAIVRDNGLNTTLRVAGGWVRDKVRHIS